MRERLEQARELGRREIRPVGLEADRLSRPIPVGDPYYARCIARGEGRTRWTPKGKAPQRDPGPPSTQTSAMRLLLAEESAYWDRGVGVANPGPGVPEGNVIANATEEQKEHFLGPFVEPDRPRWACF